MPGVPIGVERFGRFDRLALVRGAAARAGIGGEHRSRQRAPSTDFLDYRPYHAGDDFRRIDWNVYGRLGSLQVKVTEGRERLDVVVALDCSASMAWGAPVEKFAFAAQLVAALGYVALLRSDVVRVCTLGGPAALGPLRGRASLPRLTEYLGQLAPAASVDLAAALGTCLPADAREPLVVVVSDLLRPEGIDAALDRLLGWDVTLVHVLAPAELEPSLLGELELIDAETHQTLEIGASLATLSAYRRRMADWLAAQERACHSRGMRYVRLRSDQPLEQVMLADLRQAGLLR